LYGGTERVVSALTDALVQCGHEVTLFASGDSRTAAQLVPIVDAPIWGHDCYHDASLFHVTEIRRVARMADEFDVIHSHLDSLGLLLNDLTSTPVVTTLHGRLDLPDLTCVFREFDTAPLVSVSDHQRRPLPHANWLATVHNGLDLSPFQYHPRSGGYLAFLGRISPEKGLEAAIEVAIATDVPLKIAARMPLDPRQSPDGRRDWDYFHSVVEPLLAHPLVEYVGEVDDAAKNQFLGEALALLFPVQWPEPFGLAMVESLACGTPVVARPLGAVPEVVDHGLTGYLGLSKTDLVAAVHSVARLDRAACRQAAEARFSATAMVAEYERVYRRLLAPPASDACGPRRAARTPPSLMVSRAR
jgi:glycosyltransferase involved in cell wall biosynthesis